MPVTTVNFSMISARMLGLPILSQKETQKEEIIFLKNKLNREGKTGFNIPEEMDSHAEDFVEEVGKAKEGDSPVIVGEETNLNLQGHLNSEYQTSITYDNDNDLTNKWNNNATSQEEERVAEKSVEGAGNSIEEFQHKGDNAMKLDKIKDKLKDAARVVIASEEPRHLEAVIEEIKGTRDKQSAWLTVETITMIIVSCYNCENRMLVRVLVSQYCQIFQK